MTTTKELWYLTRGSGVVALVLLTASVALGVLTSLRIGTRRWPRFAVSGLHRNFTLLAIVFVVLHVVTTVADGYAPIGLKDAIIPFASPYRPIWLGLGTVAFDLLLALVVTSYLRHRIGVRLWRGVHWLAYASWPVALMHSFGTGTDARVGWMFGLGIGSLVAVSVASLARVWIGGGDLRARIGGAIAALAVPIAVFAWYTNGPARHGWARRAGTPTQLIASTRRVEQTVLARRSSTLPQAFSSRMSGTIHETQNFDGTDMVVMRFTLRGSPGGALRIDLRGIPSGGGVSMSASGVSFVPATTRTVYYGSVTGLAGRLVAATVRNAAGKTLRLTASLSLDSETGRANGIVTVGSAA